MPTTAVPTILQDPGYLFWAPLLTSEPTNTVTGSKFTDAWPTGWISLGATEEGSTLATSLTTESVMAAEFFNPLRIATTGRASSMAFALIDWTLANFKRANNGGALTTVSGTGATALAKYEEPDPGSEVRAMIGWESLDGTLRAIARQCLNTGEISAQFQKAPAKAQIACTFSFEQPAAGKPYTLYAAGTSRAGVFV